MKRTANPHAALLLSRLQAHKASLSAARDWVRKAT
jgi:hypothetical protein